MFTLTQMRNKVKRRLRQLRTTTSAANETEQGWMHSNNAIDDAINAARKKIGSEIAKSGNFIRQVQLIQTSKDIQDYPLRDNFQSIVSVIYDYMIGSSPVNSVRMVELLSANREFEILKDPMYNPSETEPYFRIIGDITYAGYLYDQDGTIIEAQDGQLIGIH